MKKFTIITLALMVISSSVLASVTYNSITPSQQVNNYLVGQMNMTLNDKLTGDGVYVNPGSFSTFCLELNEDIYVGQTYGAALNTKAIKGGEAVSDPLSGATAWLYNEFVEGNITITTTQQAWDFQAAIWELEDEDWTTYFAPTSVTAQKNAWISSAEASVWATSNYIGNIRVLNIGTVSDNYKFQDVLIKTVAVPVPGAFLLGGIGVACVGWIKRRRGL